MGLNIQDLRRAKSWSQETLAHAAGVDRGYMGKIENGKYAASLDMVEKISSALEIDPMDLFRPRSP